jgi:membrane protein DedA with SNARE-associated domain
MGADRQTLLWALVLFFGASLLFNVVNDATEGEPVLLRLGAQVLVLAALIGAIVLFVRRRG